MPTMDYTKLKNRIKEKGYTQKSLAQAIGLSESHFCQKLNGTFHFTQTDIRNICCVLHISGEDIGEYFFCPVVEKTQ